MSIVDNYKEPQKAEDNMPWWARKETIETGAAACFENFWTDQFAVQWDTQTEDIKQNWRDVFKAGLNAIKDIK